MEPAPQNGPIGIFDSGIGGLSVAAAIAEILPDERLLYVADNARAPYGPQSAKSILAYSREITRHLIGQGAKLIVVACNTATSIAIDQLRRDFPEMPFVGLEPAVKPAASGETIGVLATRATLASPRYLVLKEKYLGGKTVREDPCVGLVPIIEAEATGSPRLREKLNSILHPLVNDGVDTLVLGCTHYPMVKADIQAVAGHGVRVIDPSPAAARQVKRRLEEAGILAEPGAQRIAHDFLATGDGRALQRTLLGLPALNRHRRLLVPNVQLS
ncbi:glutamate racemase [Lewinella sp. 4G2]|uniref:glutamate racemase n=1 Tax=Lewinella sp. 4G2 TaxID=1803372 RepID=UPI0007B4A62A|nr:glutamate racemase [Lewinella sp. 4G2]OAV43224.1 glutamate racemase [Lewinella sp. 4G2]